MLPTATRASAPQVGLRAREWNCPAGSPSHAEAQWHRDAAFTHLPLRGQRRIGLCRLHRLPVSLVRPWGRQAPERGISLPPI